MSANGKIKSNIIIKQESNNTKLYERSEFITMNNINSTEPHLLNQESSSVFAIANETDEIIIIADSQYSEVDNSSQSLLLEINECNINNIKEDNYMVKATNDKTEKITMLEYICPDCAPVSIILFISFNTGNN